MLAVSLANAVPPSDLLDGRTTINSTIRNVLSLATASRIVPLTLDPNTPPPDDRKLATAKAKGLIFARAINKIRGDWEAEGTTSPYFKDDKIGVDVIAEFAKYELSKKASATNIKPEFRTIKIHPEEVAAFIKGFIAASPHLRYVSEVPRIIREDAVVLYEVFHEEALALARPKDVLALTDEIAADGSFVSDSLGQQAANGQLRPLFEYSPPSTEVADRLRRGEFVPYQQIREFQESRGHAGL